MAQAWKTYKISEKVLRFRASTRPQSMKCLKVFFLLQALLQDVNIKKKHALNKKMEAGKQVFKHKSPVC